MENIFTELQKRKYSIFGPIMQDGEICVMKLAEFPDKKLLGKVSNRPWKYLLQPPREEILQFGKKIFAPKVRAEKIALFGMSIFDLKALEMTDKVFADDIYYQARRKNIFIVGFGSVKKFDTEFFEFGGLEELPFDIFIDGGKFYFGSKAGAAVLKKCGLKFAEIKYSPRKDPASPSGLRGAGDKKVLALKKAIEKSEGAKIWEELGKICLACGKCTVACPTCYCFDFEPVIGPAKKTDRCSGNCFYDDFTRIAGGHKFLNNPAEKIFFWYFHKFVRIPYGYGLPGCVGCGRCTAVCPVGIDIEKNIKQLLKK